MSKGEEQHAGNNNQDQLAFNRGHKIEHRQANRHAYQRTNNTQRQTMPRGVIVWLADKQAGQQDPVSVLQSGKLYKRIPDAQYRGHANGMTEQG